MLVVLRLVTYGYVFSFPRTYVDYLTVVCFSSWTSKYTDIVGSCVCLLHALLNIVCAREVYIVLRPDDGQHVLFSIINNQCTNTITHFTILT